MYCSNCGNELNERAVVCPKCGCISNPELYNAAFAAARNSSTVNTPQPAVHDTPNPGFSVLSFLIPLFGIILYMADRKKTPAACKRYLTWSLVSIGLGIMFFVVYIAALIVMVALNVL
ncbi:MAG: hypothetical protein ACI4JB_05575 [Porcipelethomonas sp.]